MPSLIMYVDWDFYSALRREAEKNRKELNRFIKDTLKKACKDFEPLEYVPVGSWRFAQA